MRYSVKDLKVLHLAPDEKFIDRGVDNFNRCGCESTLYVFSKSSELKFVKENDPKVFNLEKLDKKQLCKEMESFDIIILHSLFYRKFVFPDNVVIVWIGFGFDYYNLIHNDEKYLLTPKSIDYLNNLHGGLHSRLIQKPKKILKYIKNKLKDIIIYNDIVRTLERVNYFAPVLVDEYELVKNSVLNFNPDLIDWSYGSLSDSLEKGLKDKKIIGNDILLGNSATLTNNHLDVVDVLKLSKDNSSKVITPLNYGDSVYKQYLIDELSRAFSQDSIVIDKFMPLEEYVDILARCSTVVMNHKRQQALGNISVSLYLGAKVFMNPVSPAYKYYKRNGIYIFSVDEINRQNLNYKLSTEEINFNRFKILELNSKAVIDRKTNNLLEVCVSKVKV
ncbi:TDP-N-acetylfucosamine:lipid II N-acetylfucosaminyltransferase [Vibrio breoganii]